MEEKLNYEEFLRESKTNALIIKTKVKPVKEKKVKVPEIKVPEKEVPICTEKAVESVQIPIPIKQKNSRHILYLTFVIAIAIIVEICYIILIKQRCGL